MATALTVPVAILLYFGLQSGAQQSNGIALAELTLPEEHLDYETLDLPGHFLVDDHPANGRLFASNAAVENDNTPPSNPVTDAGATLGRVLFYDETLSASGAISCASCHQQETGFSDPERFSEGFAGEETRRNSMALINARFFEDGTFFWDGRAPTLEEAVLEPFVDRVEMGLTEQQLVSLVQDQSYYQALMEDAFGDPEVNTERISLALSQFIRSIVSFESRYDEGRVQVGTQFDPFPNFTAEENLGKDLFFQAPADATPCSGCHTSEAFVNTFFGPMNNGLDAESTIDLGQFEATADLDDIGKFKAPSLRNIALTAPYMHDGRFATLTEVAEFYSTGVQDHPELAPFMRNDEGNPEGRNFGTEETAALVAFLETLTDENIATDERFSDPFPEME